jgi:uncharacterized RDD family membrane protein YckC
MSLPEETLDIQTPENVAFGYRVAGIGSRFLSILADTAILILLQVVVYAAFFVILDSLGELGGQLAAWVYAVVGLIAVIFNWGYYVFFEMLWNGQTPGKRWAGLRVIRRDGTPITLSESLIRNLARLVDFLPFAYGAGIVAMFLDKQSRRLGDLAAGTLVVHDRAPTSIESLSVRRSVNLSMRGFKLVSVNGFPIERLTNDDLTLIEDFLVRRDQLTHRAALANQILNSLHTRLSLPLPSISPTEAEDLLLSILQAAQKKDE